MADSSQIKNWYISLFKDFENHLNGEKSSRFHKLRKEAITKFAELDFPDLHQEDWRFTDVSPILKYNFNYSTKGILPSKDEFLKYTFEGMEAHIVVFVNGFYSPELSILHPPPAGTIMGSLAAAMKQGDERIQDCILKRTASDINTFTALNTAFAVDGAFVYIPENTVVEKPIHLMFFSHLADKTISQPRNLIVAGKNSQARIIEHYIGTGKDVYFTNTVTELYLGEGSNVETVKVQVEGMNAYHIATTEAVLESNSNYESQAVSLGANIYRHNLNVILKGEGGNAALEGLYLTSGSQLSDTHSLIDHAAPHCTSHENYKGILDDSSRGVFNGKIMVRKGAQQTNSYQENRNIILSNDAKVDTKPQLEIFADDVKCSHGATVGQLNKESIFYLRSRGIGEEEAKLILIYAFANDVLKNVKIEEIRNSLETVLSNRFLKVQQANR
ncbi:MAG TPA: Fe-S cluster assembly protein SufD [Candidatus Acidoferrales bacterium]|nr:Fe-S cluster assembly protein SufD [Candidatus Acidoferrales bacterium]